MAPKKPKGAFVGDPSLYVKAGINPANGLPTRGSVFDLKAGMRKILRVIDQQDAIHRYKWLNIPCELTSEEIETLLYYNGTLCFFYFKDLNKFFFMPYTLSGTIDFYGRYNRITPVPIAATSGNKNDEKRFSEQSALLSALKLQVAKAPVDLEDLTLDMFENSAVLLWDYSRQRSQIIIPRQQLNEAIIDVESDIFPFLRTSMISATGVRGMKVEDADTSDEAQKVSRQLYESALKGEIYSPFISKIDVQDLADGSPMKSEEFLLTLQALENFRLGTYGIKNGGLFQKKAHELQSESDLNSGNVATVYDDGLALRQYFCLVANSIWGFDMWCVPDESVIGEDMDFDGDPYQDNISSAGTSSEVVEEGGQENA